MKEDVVTNQILKCILKKKIINSSDLIDNLTSSNEGDSRFNRRYIFKKIKQLKDDQIIERIGDEEFQSYGITERDRRSKYFILKKDADMKKHIDAVFPQLAFLQDSDVFPRKNILKELDRYKNRYHLNSNQIQQLTNTLGRDEDSDKLIISLIYRSILDEHTEPDNIDDFLSKLEQSLTKYRGNKDKEFFKKIIHLLGYFNDNNAIKQFEKDIDTGCIIDTKDLYHSKYLINLIENQKEFLFLIQMKLHDKKDEGDVKEIGEIIDELRDYAFNNENKAVFSKKVLHRDQK